MSADYVRQTLKIKIKDKTKTERSADYVRQTLMKDLMEAKSGKGEVYELISSPCRYKAEPA